MECNVSTLKMMLYQEIKKYYDFVEESKLLRSDISVIDYVLNLLSSDDYNEMYENLIGIELSLDAIFDSDLITKKIASLEKSILVCKLSLKDELFDEDLKRAKRNIMLMMDFLQKEKAIKENKIIADNPNITPDLVDAYKDIIFSFKNYLAIQSFQYELINKLFEKLNISEKQQVMFFENIRKYNTRIHLEEKNLNVDYARQNKVLNMIKSGYEVYHVPFVDKSRREYLKSEVSMYLNLLDGSDNVSEIIDFFPVAQDYDKNELIFIIFNILNNLQNQMNDLSLFIEKKENYLDKEIRDEAVNEFYTLQIKFRMIRRYLEEQLNFYDDNYEDEKDVNELYYLMRNVKEGSYFENDLKAIPKDSWAKLKSLLVAFKKGKLSVGKSKKFNSRLTGYRELKDDQLRVIYKHLGDNKYVIIGAGIKKTDNDMQFYNSMKNRKLDPSLLAPASKVEDELFDFIDENHHYGGRTNA